jgi:hypothetical protein
VVVKDISPIEENFMSNRLGQYLFLILMHSFGEEAPQGGVSFTLKMYRKAKEELWKLKYFTMQK